MKYASFKGPDQRMIYINSRSVTYVREVNEKSYLVYFGSEHAIGIPLKADVVVLALEMAAPK